MDRNVVYQLINEAILRTIDQSLDDKEVAKGFKRHATKAHFVPMRYRVLGGILQSLNIKFGNFIEQLLIRLIEANPTLEAHPLSAGKPNLPISSRSSTFIDEYITHRQEPNSPAEFDDTFHELLSQIVAAENQSVAKPTFGLDIDVLFKSANGPYIYLEVKYNDDHDTGKFVDINRKLLKTYAGLVNVLGIRNTADLMPILYYLNPVKRYGPLYLPASHIYRGSQLFDDFLQTSYEDIVTALEQISEDESVLGIFDELYQKIRFGQTPK